MEHHIWKRRGLLAAITIFALALITAALGSSFHWINKPFPGFFLHDNLTIGPYFLPGWTGSIAGLKSLDRIVAVNGRPIQQRAELYDFVMKAPPHSTLRYGVVRDGQLGRFTIGS